MARYIGPKCKLCRREGAKLFIKGSRCLSDKCGLTRRQQAPGVHGTSRKRLSDYGRGLREKQKAKRTYGLLERQFRRYFEIASLETGNVGHAFMALLESRLDNIVYSLGMTASRGQARQFIRYGRIQVGEKVVKSPSFKVKPGLVISFTNKDQPLVRDAALPAWLSWDISKKRGTMEKYPKREQINQDINEQLIIEHYSR
ncbi:30S ribosomal protein S4 [candidate division WWE3 bacterium CG08_land_8_20_14_0_20_43_13]|uniref:Small ribosomal subunit protein uS4 n=1 Tax=candidate division WWE3 bacterium CG08_land_8_20_14_0_20_43_13 TaxID=1975087 RepID=A0A2H0X761_UNCKA|nr:MAG: 30S ribosomal protein S4 [candidate division WWE3 bacterium CG08_land_8_20_14_0_20_43_13]